MSDASPMTAGPCYMVLIILRKLAEIFAPIIDVGRDYYKMHPDWIFLQ